MNNPHPPQEAIQRLVGLVRQFLHQRAHKKDDFESLNESVRGLRLALHETLTIHFLPLSLEESAHFCNAVTDNLLAIAEGIPDGDAEYHRYCIQSVVSPFEWAMQIKEEIPDDFLTQKVLVTDIPILRPFHYGNARVRVVRPHRPQA